MRDDIYSQRNHIWIHRGKEKAHLDPNCPWVSEKYQKKEIILYPQNHIEICKWCEKRFNNWQDGLKSTTDTVYKIDGCQRCGCELDEIVIKYCDKCYTKIKERRMLKR